MQNTFKTFAHFLIFVFLIVPTLPCQAEANIKSSVYNIDNSVFNEPVNNSEENTNCSDASSYGLANDNLKQSGQDKNDSRYSNDDNFSITFLSKINSHTAKVGDIVKAKVSTDFYYNHEYIPQNSIIEGKITFVKKARKLLKSEISKDKWLHSGGFIGLEFDKIYLHHKTITLKALPCPKTKTVLVKLAKDTTGKKENIKLFSLDSNNKSDSLVNNDELSDSDINAKNANSLEPLNANKTANHKVKYHSRAQLIVDKKNLLTPSMRIQIKNNAIPMAIHTMAMVGGFYSMAILPVAYGTTGAICPSFVLRHEVTPQMKHPRLKAFGIGFAEGLPGGFLIAGAFIDGDEVDLVPGDQVTLTTNLDNNTKKVKSVIVKSTKAELAK